MRVYIVWDNDDYGSLFSPSQDAIDTIWDSEVKAQTRVDGLNSKKKKWMTKAAWKAMEVQS